MASSPAAAPPTTSSPPPTTAATAAADAAFFRALPKAELHAHLHGSIRPATLVELVAAEGHVPSPAARAVIEEVLPQPRRSLSDCFRIFDLIHGAVRDAATVRRITREMLHDCAADGVSYVEIRSTPRVLAGDDVASATASSSGVDRLEPYVRAVVETLAEVEHGCRLPLVARLLLSVNRTGSVAAAEDTVDLARRYAVVRMPAPAGGPRAPCAECVARRAAEGALPTQAASLTATDPAAAEAPAGPALYGPYVVGVELSGDPTRGDARAFLPALERARAGSPRLRVSIHAGEVMNVSETEAVLDWAPDRLGHMCVLSHTTVRRLLALLPAARPPIELCPTSNALTLHLPSLHHHPTLSPWLDAGYPLAVCTDDSGVFGVALSDELRDVAETYGLSRLAAARLAVAAFAHAFVEPPLKAALIAAAEARVAALLAGGAGGDGGVGGAIESHGT